MPPGGYRKVETKVYGENAISVVYLKDKGYCTLLLANPLSVSLNALIVPSLNNT